MLLTGQFKMTGCDTHVHPLEIAEELWLMVPWGSFQEEVIRIRGLNHPPGLFVGCRGGQSHQLENRGIFTCSLFGEGGDAVGQEEELFPGFALSGPGNAADAPVNEIPFMREDPNGYHGWDYFMGLGVNPGREIIFLK